MTRDVNETRYRTVPYLSDYYLWKNPRRIIIIDASRAAFGSIISFHESFTLIKAVFPKLSTNTLIPRLLCKQCTTVIVWVGHLTVFGGIVVLYNVFGLSTAVKEHAWRSC